MRSRPSTSFPRASRSKLRYGIVSPVLILASSCSLVFDLSPDQCGETTECAHFGATFECRSGICVDTATPGSGGSTSGSGGKGTAGKGGSTNPNGGTAGGGATSGNTDGGTSATGGSSSGGKGGSSSGKGGSSSGKGGASSGTTGDSGAGAGGEPFVPECENHDDCFVKYGEVVPRACVDGTCVELKNDDCPLILPLDDTNYDALRDGDALVIGAFAPIDEITLTTVPSFDFDLAINEFNDTVNGINVAGGTRRKIAMVVCNLISDDLLRPAGHLIDDLKVEAVVGTLLTKDQQTVVEEKGLPAGTFFMLTLNSDRTLINLEDNGTVWSMLAGGDALAVTYQPLIDMTITHLKNQGVLGPAGGPYEDARIALVTATDERFLNDLGSAFRDTIHWNAGKDSTENTPDAFVSVGTTSDLGGGDSFDRTDDINEILALSPHIIVGATEREMIKPGGIIDLVENHWNDDATRATQPRPFYILSPYVFDSPDMAFIATNEFLDGLVPPPIKRLVGINWPAAADKSVFNAFQGRFTTAYSPAQAGNSENFYDSAYFTIYAIAAAGAPLTGENIGEGMLRITEGSTEYEVGPNDMSDALAYLKANPTSRIKLIGTMGPPNWNSVGGRDDAASVWCYGSTGSFQPDRYRYNEQSGMLEGSFNSFNCFAFPEPPP